jgi:cytochrome c oxidase subunit I+III
MTPRRFSRYAGVAGDLAVDVGADELRALDATWRRNRGPLGWLSATGHKEIGLRFVVTAFVFFALAGTLALLMRIQLAVPENRFLSPAVYDQLFSTHGTAMMFLFAVPVMEGMGLYLVPLMVGTRNVSFPRLLNFGYFVYLSAGIALFVALLSDVGPVAGWSGYVPLAGPEFTPGKRSQLWAQIVTLVEISALVGAIEILTTVFKQRAPGMTLSRIPLFVWAHVVASAMIVFAMPAVMLSSTMLTLDRLTNVGTHFYNQAEGGDALLGQHLFWFFAHPAFYIFFLPATGFVSAILPTFARRRIFGYLPQVLALTATAFLGFGVWVNHMFTTPLPRLGQGLFTASSLMIVIPTGLQFFCWTATLWGGKPRIELPMAFVLAFFAVFLIGGLTGVMLASVGIDLQVHDTFFVVAHLHYALIGGSVFPLIGAIYYWFPKWTGRMLDATLGWWNLALLFVGFNLTFFPMHQLGLLGMTRRVSTYSDASGFGQLNLLASIGAGVLGASMLVLFANVVWSRKRGELAGADPWGGDTLEWATSSPPPSYDFARLPSVRGRYPVWEGIEHLPVVTGLSSKTREVLVTGLHDAAPDHRYVLAGESPWPPILALVTASALIGMAFHPVAVPIGVGAALVVLAGWFWHRAAVDLGGGSEAVA